MSYSPLCTRICLPLYLGAKTAISPPRCGGKVVSPNGWRKLRDTNSFAILQSKSHFDTTLLYEEGDFLFTDLQLRPSDCVSIPNTYFTAKAYGPITAIGWWERGYKEPNFLITNFDLVNEACYWYEKRFQIETFFSDEKSRGFNLHKSHLSDPDRLARLMIAACLAYLWIIYLGNTAHRDNWVSIIHRTDRCDWSLFRIGLALLDHFLNEHLPIPVSFLLTCSFQKVSGNEFSNYDSLIRNPHS